jgi:hypothetical protein
VTSEQQLISSFEKFCWHELGAPYISKWKGPRRQIHVSEEWEREGATELVHST